MCESFGLGHLEGEDSDRLLVLDRRGRRHVQGKRRFPHRGTRCDDHEVARLQQRRGGGSQIVARHEPPTVRQVGSSVCDANPSSVDLSEAVVVEVAAPRTGRREGRAVKIITYFCVEKVSAAADEAAVKFKDPNPVDLFGMAERSIDFMKKQQTEKKPFFLQLSWLALHQPQNALAETVEKYKKKMRGGRERQAQRAALAENMDTAVGRILDAVDELGLSGNTYVIYMSDNGGNSRTSLLGGGKGNLREGGIRVPFVVVGPGVKQGSLSRVPVTGLDILPTLADLADYRSPLPDSLDGGSLRPVLRGGDTVTRARPFLIFHQAVARKAQSAIREGDFKLVKHWEQKQVELFDLSQDRSEARNLSQKMPDVRKDLECPGLPFVVGVLGVGGVRGERVNGKKIEFKRNQAAVGAMEEFKGNVAIVQTDQYWDVEADAVFTNGWKENLEEWKRIGSDRPYHYLGSVKCYNRIGSAFAEALLQLSSDENNSSDLVEEYQNFLTKNLVAWCIVPFDAKNRGPADRAEMVRDMCFNRRAYDWREQQIPEFEQEITQRQQKDLE